MRNIVTNAKSFVLIICCIHLIACGSSEAPEPLPAETGNSATENLPEKGQGSSPPEIETLNDIIEDELLYQNVLGASVAVVRDGAIVHAKGYGFTSPEKDVPVTTETVFRWASISKTLTAVAVLQLDEASENFSIDDMAGAHVDYWPSDVSNKGNVSVKQLLTHRSGIGHYRTTRNCPGNPMPDYDRELHGDIPFNARLAVGTFSNEPLCFMPGSDYRYSTFAYSLAAAAIEKTAGQTYTDWVEEKIASPLGMNSLVQGTGESTGFGGGCGDLTLATEGSKSYVLPGGGWASNITDLAGFANGLLQGDLLADTARLWNEPTGNSNTYRLGINLSLDNQSAGHGGAHKDLRTFMHLYHAREDKVGIVVYLNNPDSDPERMAKRVADGLGISNWSVPLDGGCR